MTSHGGPATRRAGWVAVGTALITLLALTAAQRAEAQAARESLWVTNGSVHSVAYSNNTVYIGGSFSQVGPATGGAVAIDRTTGAPVLPYPKVSGWVYAVAADGAGGWYVGGLFSGVGGQPRTNLAHFDASGVLDSWAPEPDGEVRSLAVYSGVLYVGGNFQNIAGQARSRLAAFDVAGGNLTSWNPGSNAKVFAFAPGEGTIYAGGDFTTIGGQARNALAELSVATGSATAFNPNINGGVRSLLRGPLAEQLCVGGFFSLAQGQTRNNIAAYNTTTGLLMSWAPDANGGVLALGFYGGTVYAGGNFSIIGGASRVCVAALDGNTGGATSWNPGASSTVEALKVVISGNITPVVTIYIGGLFNSVGGQPRINAASISSGGTVTSWNPNVNHEVFTMDAAGNSIYVGGRFTSVGGVARGNGAAFDVSTSALLPWNPLTNGYVYSIVAPGSSIYIGGGFTTVQGVGRSGVAAVDPATGAPTAWNPGVPGEVRAMAEYFGTLYLGGAFSSVGGVARNNAAAVDLNTGAVLAFNPNVNSFVNALTYRAQSSFPFTVTVFLGGQFNLVGGQSRACLASVDGTSGALNAWNPAPNDYVYAVTYTAGGITSPGTVWFGGAFTTVGGTSRRRAAAVDAGTGALKAWDPNSDHIVFKILPGSGVVYLGGRFTTIGGQSRPSLASVDATTGALTSWNPRVGGIPGQTNGFVFALMQWSGTLYACGSFTTAQWGPHQMFAGFSDATVTAVDGAPAPAAPRALFAAPNPTSAGAELRFSLASPERVEVAVYDVSGRLVRRLHRGMLQAGAHRVRWDGHRESGAPVASGVYMLRLETPTERRSSKVMVVK